jgi:beta-barrel assembly-enhancing protease
METARFHRRHFLWAAGVMGAAMLLPPALLLAEEPHVADAPWNTLTPEEEVELGSTLAAEFEREVEILRHARIDTYLNAMVRRLGAASQRPGWRYQIKVVNQAEVNAIAMPGGFLYVNRGLLEFVEDENELAGVAAHEIGHVVARHTTNQLVLSLLAHKLYERVKRNIFLDNDTVPHVIEMLGGPVVMLAQLHYSRENEEEADLLGFYEMLRAGWNPAGMVRFLTRLAESESAVTPLDVMLSDHPASAERARRIRREVDSVEITAPAVCRPMEYSAMKTALRLLPPEPAPSRG